MSSPQSRNSAGRPEPTLPADRGAGAAVSAFVARLRRFALQGLARMYRPEEGLFVFRLRRTANGIVPEGLSRRYTAIALIGLCGEDEAAACSVIKGRTRRDLAAQLLADGGRMDTVGDLGLILWAAHAAGVGGRDQVLERLLGLRPVERTYPAVELAWVLTALSLDPAAKVGDLRERLAHRLIASLDRRSGLFPHVLGDGRFVRSHVSCFADLVYPVQALARYHQLTGERAALEAARRCGEQICRAQGPAGQWWWHHDLRTGRVVEPYPVYAVHQDAMAPMALFALEEAGGSDFSSAVWRGLAWLMSSPELGGRSLVDEESGLIWRKVARREPGKLSRYVQAAASRLHPALRVPGLDVLFPPHAVDHEDRPYHLGWLLHAWPSPANGQPPVEAPL